MFCKRVQPQADLIHRCASLLDYRCRFFLSYLNNSYLNNAADQDGASDLKTNDLRARSTPQASGSRTEKPLELSKGPASLLRPLLLSLNEWT
jgi:hypothetical protein